MPVWMNVVKNNLKLAAAGAAAVLVAGTGAAATVSLAGSESDVAPDAVVVASASPSPLSPVSDTPTVGIEPDGSDDASPSASPSPSGTASAGVRPTDTHGYCVSTAVHAATATAGINLGAAKSAAAHSCPKPGQAAKPSREPKPVKTRAAKPAHANGHGRPAGVGSEKVRGKSASHRP